MKEILVYFFAALALAGGQLIIQGRCPKAKLVKDFDMERYSGQWYEVYRYENFRQKGSDCGVSIFTYKNETLELFHGDLLDKDYIIYTGNMSVDENANGEAKLTFVSDEGWKMPYWILNTDYKRHSLVYACVQQGENKIVYSWLLSRHPTLSATSVINMDPDVRATELIWENYRVTNTSEIFCNDFDIKKFKK